MICTLEADPGTVADTDRWQALGLLYMKTGRYRDERTVLNGILTLTWKHWGMAGSW